MEKIEYIFREEDDGLKFVGDFDGMYSNVEDPWGQCRDVYYAKRNKIILNVLLDIEPMSVLDMGCGLGQITQMIQLLITHDVKGIDISGEAIRRARTLFPTVSFEQRNIITESLDDITDCALMSGILWYILKDIDKIFSKIFDSLYEGGHLVIFQTFIPDQKYGREIVDGYAGWLKYLNNAKGFNLIETRSYIRVDNKTDSLAVLRKEG